MEFRYENIKLKYMKKITVKKNKDNKPIIYVQKCDNFSKNVWKTVK